MVRRNWPTSGRFSIPQRALRRSARCRGDNWEPFLKWLDGVYPRSAPKGDATGSRLFAVGVRTRHVLLSTRQLAASRLVVLSPLRDGHQDSDRLLVADRRRLWFDGSVVEPCNLDSKFRFQILDFKSQAGDRTSSYHSNKNSLFHEGSCGNSM